MSMKKVGVKRIIIESKRITDVVARHVEKEAAKAAEGEEQNEKTESKVIMCLCCSGGNAQCLWEPG